MNNTSVLNELRKPFRPDVIEFKPGATKQDAALGLFYADVRAYQNRLDEVCGMNWAVTFTPWGERVVCHLTINGVTRSSTGEGDAQSEKSEIAGTAAEAQAFKRACSCFGLGRYLYELPDVWAEFDPAKKKFTAQGEAKLIKVVFEHYKRHSSAPVQQGGGQAPEQASEGVALETMERLHDEFAQLGESLYGEQWAQVSRHNIERITSGEAIEPTGLTLEQIQRLIEGMKTLQRKRNHANGTASK